MKYIVLDGNLNGTGIRDKYNGGYIDPVDLGITQNLVNQLNHWLKSYENEHYNGYKNIENVEYLDRRGEDLAKKIKDELVNIKLEYFSAGKLSKKILF